MSIEVSGLTKRYGEQTAVDHIAFSVKKGEIIGFLGPNGAGKSTTMKMLTGYIPPDEGTASIAGIDVVKEPLKAKAKIGYLPENNPLYTDMYVAEYLDLAAGLSRISNRKERVRKVIEITGITPEVTKRISQLSKGYRQRVGLAQALIHDPDVLILDEPTSGLDPNQLVGIRKLIREIGKEKTVMLSTHIMQEVEIMCDRVIILDQGRIVADRPVSRKDDVAGMILLEVQLENPVTDEQLADRNISLQRRTEGNTIIVSGTDRQELSRLLFRMAQETGNVIFGITEPKEDLESMFRELTGKKQGEENTGEAS